MAIKTNQDILRRNGTSTVTVLGTDMKTEQAVTFALKDRFQGLYGIGEQEQARRRCFSTWFFLIYEKIGE
jgi:hypothetical protein